MCPMQIRRVNTRNPDVQKTLLDLQKRCLPHDVPMATDSGYWWICYDVYGNELGFAGLIASVRWANTGYLCRAGVVPSNRGHGIQKKLIRVRIKQAKALGWKWLITDTYRNPPSSNSLISCGFKLFDPSYLWGVRETLYWRKKID